jgi:hypothetical protein
MPQDRLPGIRQYCDDRCATKARLFTKARERMTVVKALSTAVRRLSNSRMPVVVAATAVLAELRDQLVDSVEAERATRVAAFLAKLPPVA